jgi:chromosome partitioning protein
MTRVYAISNVKGGVGKTTATENIGIRWAYDGERVLLIDLDSDCCLTDALLGEKFTKSTQHLSILDVLTNPAAGIASAVVPYTTISLRGKVDMIAGSTAISEAPERFAAARVQQPVAQFDEVLSWLFRQPFITEQYTTILLDLGPNWDIITKTALFSAQSAIIPIIPAPLAISALKRLKDRIDDANRDRSRAGFPGRTDIIGVLLSQVGTDKQRVLADRLRTALNAASIPCCTTAIPFDDAVWEATGEHLPVWQFAPSAPASLAFIALAQELAEKSNA